MSEVTITVSKNDFKRMIKNLYLGHWILTATKDESSFVEDAFYEKMLSLAKNYINFDGIEYDDESNRYFVTSEKEEEWNIDISEYNEDTFWEELIERLGQRDVEEKNGKEDFFDIDVEKRSEEFHKEVLKYYEEIEKNGIQNFGIKSK